MEGVTTLAVLPNGVCSRSGSGLLPSLCFLLSHLLSQVHRESRKGDFVSTKKYWTLPKSCGSQSSKWEELKKSRAKRGSLCARRRSRKTVACHGLRVVEPVYHQALLRGRSRSWRRNGRKAGLGEARFVNFANLARQLHRSCLICCFFFPLWTGNHCGCRSTAVEAPGGSSAKRRTLQVRMYCSISCLVHHISQVVFCFACM